MQLFCHALGGAGTAVARARLDADGPRLTEVTRAIARELQAVDPQRRAEFLIVDQLSCRGDRELLKVALRNLLGNAWKYSAKEARSIIEFGALSEEGPAPAFYVRDNGVGCDSNYAGKLFDLFSVCTRTMSLRVTGSGWSR